MNECINEINGNKIVSWGYYHDNQTQVWFADGSTGVTALQVDEDLIPQHDYTGEK